MTGSNMYFLALSAGLAISIIGFIVVLLSPKTNSTQFHLSNTEHLSPMVVKVITLFGGDILAMLPSDTQKRNIANKEINDLFMTSGNPWEVTKLDFFTLRIAYAFIGIIIGIAFSFVGEMGLGLGGIITIVTGYIGWNRPVSVYKGIAEDREEDFKKHFPELLDYLTMIMGNTQRASTLGNSIELAIKYIPESAVKYEFSRVTDSINAGMSSEMALNNLAERLPSPALRSFVNAVNNANKLNSPMDELMEKRAKKSREDMLNDMEVKIQTLPSKTLAAVAPAAIISMVAIFAIPVVVAMLSTI